jgi:CheY-like chemotaxis protein
MPRMGGIEVLNSLKSDDALSDIPVIILTAQADQNTITECLDAGANDYIIKPFPSNGLWQHLKFQGKSST